MYQWVEACLRCFVSAKPSKWCQWLSLPEYWYNTSYHTAIDKTPFEVCDGHPPDHLGIEIKACATPDLMEWLEERQVITALLRQQLERAKQRMKSQANKKHSERSFEVGDSVFLKLQPYIQSSVAHRASHKLSYRYFGPYPVIGKVGEVAYKLQLPQDSSVHPVFHVSHLKKALLRNKQVDEGPPPIFDKYQVPQEFLERRLRKSATHMVLQVLVHWTGADRKHATWEDSADLRCRFPYAPAWGQAGFEEEGIVTDPTCHPSTNKAKRNKRPNPRVQGDEWTR